MILCEIFSSDKVYATFKKLEVVCRNRPVKGRVFVYFKDQYLSLSEMLNYTIQSVDLYKENVKFLQALSQYSSIADLNILMLDVKVSIDSCCHTDIFINIANPVPFEFPLMVSWFYPETMGIDSSVIKELRNKYTVNDIFKLYWDCGEAIPFDVFFKRLVAVSNTDKTVTSNIKLIDVVSLFEKNKDCTMLIIRDGKEFMPVMLVSECVHFIVDTPELHNLQVTKIIPSAYGVTILTRTPTENVAVNEKTGKETVVRVVRKRR